MKSFPHLSNNVASTIVAETLDKDPSHLASLISWSHPKMTLSESGYPFITETELGAFRDEVLAVAERYGFPSGYRGSLSDFDQAIAPIIFRHVSVTPAEARTSSLWNYVSCCLLIDVALWRFPNHKQSAKFNRLIGDKAKNAFARLWWRVYVLQDQYKVGEDEAVALLERTSLAGDPELAQLIVEVFNDNFVSEVHGGRSEVFRIVSKHMRLASAITCFPALSSTNKRQAVEKVILRVLDQCAQARKG